MHRDVEWILSLKCYSWHASRMCRVCVCVLTISMSNIMIIIKSYHGRLPEWHIRNSINTMINDSQFPTAVNLQRLKFAELLCSEQCSSWKTVLLLSNGQVTALCTHIYISLLSKSINILCELSIMFEMKNDQLGWQADPPSLTRSCAIATTVGQDI